MTINEFRKKINDIQTVGDLIDIISNYKCKKSVIKSGYSDMISAINGHLIGWNRDKSIIYVTKYGELVIYANDDSLEEYEINYILDDILELDTDAGFYRLYYLRYGYKATDDMSKIVKDAIDYFSEHNAIVNGIFVSTGYDSVTITGKKVNNAELELRLISCDKKDILDLVSITHVQPSVNKPNKTKVDDYYKYDKPYHPPVSMDDIMDSYNDYRCSNIYD